MKSKLTAILLICALALIIAPTALGAEAEDSGPIWQSVLYQGQELNDVRNIVPTATGYWVCTKGGLYFVSNSGQLEQMFSNVLKTAFIYDIAMDAAGNYYVTQGFTYAGGINYGLLHISGDGELLQQYTAENSPLPDDFVQAVEVDAAGRVWIGSGTGLSCLDPATDSWQIYTKAEGLPASAVNTLLPDGAGGLWIGCYPNAAPDGGAPFDGGYAYMGADGKIKAWHYAASKDDKLNSYLLGDFWARGMALDGAGGVYIVRSGGAAAYFGSPNYLGADGKPIPIADCVGGRLDHIGADKQVTHYTGRELSPVINDSIVPTDYVNAVDGLTPEIRVVGSDAQGGLWLGTSGAGLLAAAAVNGEYAHYSSANGDFPNAFFDNIWAIAMLPGGNIAAGSQGGLRVLGAAAGPEPEPLKVSLSTHRVEIDGKAVSLAAYNINGSNYFKLRDLAYALNGGAKQFDISFDAASASIDLLPGQAYTPAGGEMAPAASGGELKAGASTHQLLLMQAPALAQAYNINGNNYFMLRDMGRLLDFYVGWDGGRQAVIVNTGQGYAE